MALARAFVAAAGLALAPALASGAGSDGATGADERPPRAAVPRYQTLRYLEDNRHLARAGGGDPFDPIKYLPLGGGAWLSFGGQHRWRYELVDGKLEGPSGPGRTSVMLVRNLVHADAHWGPGLRLFAQAGAHAALGDPAAGPPDADSVDLHQAFVEASARARGLVVTTRVGRQEMALGSTRWVGVRDGTNVRQAFDLVRVTAAGGSWSGETFLGGVPALERGAFDDRFDGSNRFWGSYWSFRGAAPTEPSFEAYYLGRARAEARYVDAAGPETRHMLGTRIFGRLGGGPEYIAHAIAQAGAVGGASVRAWGAAFALWQPLPGPLASARVGVRGDALSGDARRGDGRVGTFHPFFPNQTFFSALPAIYPANLYGLHPLVTWGGGAFTAEVGCIFFWRQSVEDAVYRPPGVALAETAASRARYTGAQPSISIGHRVTPHLTINAEYARVFAGPGLAAAVGRGIDYLGTWTTLTY
ncbi:MAG: alginate export family protein [Polyangiaceae bacterium]|nr:alginate export family protein [Polyangiaceae bacterium]